MGCLDKLILPQRVGEVRILEAVVGVNRTKGELHLGKKVDQMLFVR